MKKKLVSKSVLTSSLNTHKLWDICILFCFLYNYIFSLANNPNYNLLPTQYSYAKNIANSPKEHNIVGPNCNSHYHNKELEAGRTDTLYRWLSVYRGRSGRTGKILPP